MYETQKKRRIRRPAAWLLAVLLTGVLCCQAVWADQRALIPVGKAVGIKLFADGVLVVSTSETDPCPARDCGIREGDLIVSCNGKKVTSTEDLQALLQATGGQPAAIGLRREGKTLNVTAAPVQGEDGSWRLGAWTRDSMAGVGTLTFYDPDTGAYGALGHGITDTDTAQLMPLSSGSIMETSVKAVKKGEKGEPGQLKGDFTAQHDVGTVSANTTGGIFGTVAEGDFVSGTALPVAQRSQVTTGPATILSTVSGDDTRAYQVEIVRLCPMNRDGRDLLLKVTDPQLLETTGGIVQGMSGSPIIQNGRFVGAVTHVLVNDPSQGYGILLEHMLEAVG